MPIDYKKLAADRREYLNEIRRLLRLEFPNEFTGCVQSQIIDVLSGVLMQAKAVERGRDAFRDELIRLGYTHEQLVGLADGGNRK